MVSYWGTGEERPVGEELPHLDGIEHVPLSSEHPGAVDLLSAGVPLAAAILSTLARSRLKGLSLGRSSAGTRNVTLRAPDNDANGRRSRSELRPTMRRPGYAAINRFAPKVIASE